MNRSLLKLLPALLFCLPASADMPAGLQLGDKKKDVVSKVTNSSDFKMMNAKSSKSRLENNYRLKDKVGGQHWLAHFLFESRSRELKELIFVGEKSMRPEKFRKLLKPFYVFTTNQLRERFELQDPINTPTLNKISEMEKELMYPLHAYPGEGFLLTAGLWMDKDGGMRLCFSMQPTNSTALGNTFVTNTNGSQEEWENIPDFTKTPAGKAFLAGAGMDEEEPEDEGDAAEADTKPRGSFKIASKQLPQVEQDTLNGLLRLSDGKDEEGMEKLTAAAEAGNARALYELGCCYAEGLHGLQQDADQAENLIRKAATGGYALALVRYGAEFPVALEKLGLTAEDGKRMVQELYKAISGPHPSARFNYAMMLRHGYGVRKDAAKALEIMQQLIREGDPAAPALAAEWEE